MMIEELGSGAWPLFLGLFLILFVIISAGYPSDSMKIPTVKYSCLLPDFTNRMMYYAVGKKLIHKGYKKVFLQNNTIVLKS